MMYFHLIIKQMLLPLLIYYEQAFKEPLLHPNQINHHLHHHPLIHLFIKELDLPLKVLKLSFQFIIIFLIMALSILIMMIIVLNQYLISKYKLPSSKPTIYSLASTILFLA